MKKLELMVMPYVRLVGKEKEEFPDIINDKIFDVGKYLFVPKHMYEEWKSLKNCGSL